MRNRKKFACLHYAGPRLGALMVKINCLGITMPWRVAYIGLHRDPKVIRHELVHLAQIRRDGDLKFWVMYLYHCVRSGYRGNPYEAEADRLSGTYAYH